MDALPSSLCVCVLEIKSASIKQARGETANYRQRHTEAFYVVEVN